MRSMLKKDFWYDLPKELIAQEPAAPRDAARLMVLSQKDDSIQHRIFRDLPEYLEPGDLLVVNNSKVLPARIVGVKQPTGAVCGLLLLRQVRGDQWECLAKPGKRMQPGTKVSFGDGTLTAVVDETLEDGNKFVTFYYDTETLYEKLDEFGKMPLPPYITKQLDDQSQYQTVYAKELGSAAAPTAGLHFTPELMDTLRAKGVGIAEVTLHVGLGTFRPVMEDEITDHKMHSEWYSISEETAQRIRETKAAGHRVIAVGTTSCRTLEAVAAKYGEIKDLQRQHVHLPVSRCPVPLHRRPYHQLPPARKHPHHAGIGALRLRKDHGCIQGCCGTEVPLFQFWRCDADPVTLKFTLVSRIRPAGIERSVVLWYTISDDAAGLRHRMHGCFPCTERKCLCLL